MRGNIFGALGLDCLNLHIGILSPELKIACFETENIISAMVLTVANVYFPFAFTAKGFCILLGFQY